MQRAKADDERVEQAFKYLVTVLVEHCIGRHQVAHGAHQHQAAAGNFQRAAVGREIAAVGVQSAGLSLAALVEATFEGALHQAEPVAIELHFVARIDRCDRILAVHDRGNRGFEEDVADAGRV